MAHIKIRGYGEPITVPDEAARELRNKRIAGLVGDHDQVSIGSFSGENSEIRAIIVSDEPVIPENHYFEEWLTTRHKLLDLSPADRAQVSAWGHFSLTYYVLTGKTATESMKESTIKAAEKFYEKNPRWARPSIKFWMKVLGKSGAEVGMGYEHGFKILERCEAEELAIVGSVNL